jgi:hypothetical protein
LELSILPEDAAVADRRGLADFGEGREALGEAALAVVARCRRTGRFFVTVFAI